MKMMDSWAQWPLSLQSNPSSCVRCPALLLAVIGCWGCQSPKMVNSALREWV